AGAVDDALRDDEALLRPKFDRASLEIDHETALDEEEEFFVVFVLLPVFFPLHDAEPNDRAVHLTKRLVVPAIGAGSNQIGNVDELERGIADIEMGWVGRVLC